MECKHCQSSYIKKFGIRYNRRKINIQRVICGSCGKTFSVGLPEHKTKIDKTINIANAKRIYTMTFCNKMRILQNINSHVRESNRRSPRIGYQNIFRSERYDDVLFNQITCRECYGEIMIGERCYSRHIVTNTRYWHMKCALKKWTFNDNSTTIVSSSV